MYKTIKIEKLGTVWKVVLNRPEVKNAHDLETFKEITRAFEEVEADPDCRCAVLTGEGDFFSAGQDLRFTASATAAEVDEYGTWNVAARMKIQKNFKPVIAALNGPAIGGGAYLATSCDLIVAVDTAYLQMREIHAGNHSGGAFLFSVGRVRSLEISLLGRRIHAPEAERWGLINRSVGRESFAAAVDEYVQALVELPPLAVRYSKYATNLLLDSAGFTNHIEATAAGQRLLMLTPDGREAKKAFTEKRKPRFTGAHPRFKDQ